MQRNTCRQHRRFFACSSPLRKLEHANSIVCQVEHDNKLPVPVLRLRVLELRRKSEDLAIPRQELHDILAWRSRMKGIHRTKRVLFITPSVVRRNNDFHLLEDLSIIDVDGSPVLSSVFLVNEAFRELVGVIEEHLTPEDVNCDTNSEVGVGVRLSGFGIWKFCFHKQTRNWISSAVLRKFLDNFDAVVGEEVMNDELTLFTVRRVTVIPNCIES